MLDIKDYAQYIDTVFPDGTAEADLIAEAYNTLLSGLPTTNSQAFSMLSTLDSLKPQMTALIFGLSTRILEMQKGHDFEYNKAYTKWTNTGTKPSHQAVESQIYKDNLDLFGQKYIINHYQLVLDFVKSITWNIDKARESVMLAWKDANTY